MNNSISAPIVLRIWGVLVLLFFFERCIKFVVERFVPTEGIFLLGRGFGFIPEYNQGIAFSIPLPKPLLVLLLLCIVGILVVLHVRAKKLGELHTVWGTGLMIVGALSNGIDRILHGSVLDFIRLLPFPTFNFADLFVLFGVSILLLQFVRDQKARHS